MSKQESKPFIILFKDSLKTDLFGSLSELFKEYGGEITYSLSYLRKIDFYLEDYEDDRVIIRKQTIKRSAQSKNIL